MAELTTDYNDPELGHWIDKEQIEQHKKYLILSEEERVKGFIRPVRQSYVHLKCGTLTTMSLPIAETYARDPNFYGATYCCACKKHLPVDQFVWDGTNEKVGS
jgi:hypothetical protein